MKSLDPRVNRLPAIAHQSDTVVPESPRDQFGTFEVFVQPREGKPFQHEGAVHAPNLELAYVLAKEAFTRRFTCVSLYVVDTGEVYVSPITEGHQSIYELLPDTLEENAGQEEFEIYHLMKRGKQHVHAGRVTASSAYAAFIAAKTKLRPDKIVYSLWAIPVKSIRFTTDEEKDLWLTLPEKKFRDATDYKGGSKLEAFLAGKGSQQQ